MSGRAKFFAIDWGYGKKTYTFKPVPVNDDPLDLHCFKCGVKRKNGWDIHGEFTQYGFDHNLHTICVSCKNCGKEYAVQYSLPADLEY